MLIVCNLLFVIYLYMYSINNFISYIVIIYIVFKCICYMDWYVDMVGFYY